MNRKALIIGIKSYKLSSSEKTFLKKIKPWGVILFSRNIKNISQVKSLTDNIKNIFKDKNYPILIDMEGGNVSRLNKIVNFSIFSQSFFGKLFKSNKKLFLIYYKIYIDTVSTILKDCGININTVPNLDQIRKKSHSIIGTRSFSNNPNEISQLGKFCINFYNKNKIGTVIKHIPGHGLSISDSHFKTPIIKSSIKKLKLNDFKAFKNVNSFFAMTAHIIYPAFDNLHTATHSKIIITKVIRGFINFNGILISDDISMKSLKFSLQLNAINALKAGCNLVLHCNGNLAEAYKIAKVIPKIDNFTKIKTGYFYKFLR
jgi:beta-N-acetylhexosaminidase